MFCRRPLEQDQTRLSVSARGSCDWTSYLKHRQSILFEFDTDGAPEEVRFDPVLPRKSQAFYQGPDGTTRARRCGLGSREELVEKARRGKSGPTTDTHHP